MKWAGFPDVPQECHIPHETPQGWPGYVFKLGLAEFLRIHTYFIVWKCLGAKRFSACPLIGPATHFCLVYKIYVEATIRNVILPDLPVTCNFQPYRTPKVKMDTVSQLHGTGNYDQYWLMNASQNLPSSSLTTSVALFPSLYQRSIVDREKVLKIVVPLDMMISNYGIVSLPSGFFWIFDPLEGGSSLFRPKWDQVCQEVRSLYWCYALALDRTSLAHCLSPI